MFKWLDEEPTWKQVVVWIPLSAMGFFAYSMCLVGFAMSFELMPVSSIKSVVHLSIREWNFLPMLFVHAFMEEFLFRYLPAIILLDRRSSSFDVGFYILLTSFTFGLVHGGSHYLVFQGVGGLLFALVFLKCGGVRERYFFGLLASSTAHTCVNAITAFLLFTNGIDTF